MSFSSEGSRTSRASPPSLYLVGEKQLHSYLGWRNYCVTSFSYLHEVGKVGTHFTSRAALGMRRFISRSSKRSALFLGGQACHQSCVVFIRYVVGNFKKCIKGEKCQL